MRGVLASLKSSEIALLCRPDLTVAPDLETLHALGEWISFCELDQVVIPIAPAVWCLCLSKVTHTLVPDMQLLTWKMSFYPSLSMSSTRGLLFDSKVCKTGLSMIQSCFIIWFAGILVFFSSYKRSHWSIMLIMYGPHEQEVANTIDICVPQDGG